MTTPQDFLNQLRIASPCPAAWADMAGDDRARFCAQCEKHVYDFSKMTAAEGLALIREKEGNICGRLWRRADGTLITADCPVGMRLAQRRRLALPWTAAAVFAAGLSGLGCTPRLPKTDLSAQAVEARADGSIAKKKRVTVVVGGAAITTMDVTTTATGQTLSSGDWERLPLR